MPDSQRCPLLFYRTTTVSVISKPIPDLQNNPLNLKSKTSPLLLIRKKCASHFCNEPANEMSTWVYNSHLIRQSFQGYCAKSGLAIFAVPLSHD